MTENEFLLQDRIAKIRSINEQHNILDNSYISLSGGKDSTVLSYLMDEALPGNKIPRVFLNTGIEFKLIYIYIRKMQESDSRIEIVNVGKNIKETLSNVGYPFKSKEHSQKLYEYKSGLRGKAILKYFRISDGGYNSCPEKLMYQMNDDFKLNISHRCCLEFKKKPAKEWAKKNNKTILITGMRKDEGGTRSTVSCTSFNSDNQLTRFHPLFVVNDDFENWFIESRKIKLCDLYYPPYNLTRTGCKGCPFTPWLEKDLYMMGQLLPEERKQCEIIWKPVYDEYRRIGYRLSKCDENKLFDW